MKLLCLHPPQGVSEQQAQIAGMMMYYGGDLIDALLITMLCYQWYKADRPKGVSVKAS